VSLPRRSSSGFAETGLRRWFVPCDVPGDRRVMVRIVPIRMRAVDMSAA
jgi:hypothetical protein